jgi:hypothetical protein
MIAKSRRDLNHDRSAHQGKTTKRTSQQLSLPEIMLKPKRKWNREAQVQRFKEVLARTRTC